MPIQLVKSKYKKNEVQAIISRIESEYEIRISEQRNKIKELLRDNNELRTKIEEYTEKESLIVKAVIRSEQLVEENSNKVEALYQLELERLKKFFDKWNGYFKELKEKYPLNPVMKNAIDIKDTLVKNSLSGKKAKEIIEELDTKIDIKGSQKNKFDPKSRIKDYIAATNEGGFNMDEVLNPGALKLEDICKELGLIEED